MSKRILLTLALVSVLILVAACNDDDDCVDCPDTGAPYPTMANVWPHEDGTAWTYELGYQEVLPNPDPGKADEVPSMEDLHAALQVPLEGEIQEEGEGLFRFALDGMVETESGAMGQNVVQTIFVEMPSGPMRSINEVRSGNDPLLAMIARARPDLRPALEARFGLDEKANAGLFPPLFMGGYAFAYEDSGCYSYGDVEMTHSWTYLEGDLTVGSEFSLQLVPSLAADVWLYGRIWSIGNRTVGGHTYENVVECMYVLEYGETELVDDEGNPLDITFFPYGYGHTFYAPEEGPISGVERQVHFDIDLLPEVHFPVAEFDLDLVGVTFPE